MITSSRTVNILGFPTSSLSREEILAMVSDWLSTRSATRHLMALNPIKVCRARKEDRLARHIVESDLLYPDAFGIAWAMRFQGLRRQKPIPGCDLMLDILRVAADHSSRVFLLGASENVVTKTAELFTKTHPGATIVGYHSGFFATVTDRTTTLQTIMEKKPDIVFVAMGALVQEDWIEMIKAEANRQGLTIPLLMGVGGSFDAVTGHVPRPPRWMLNLHLEWLFRLLQQPFRAPRMIALPRFAIMTILKHWFKVDLDWQPASQGEAG